MYVTLYQIVILWYMQWQGNNFSLVFCFQDDPKAHDNFLKITRAYEVLKDEDLRKKYDMHGEEGLKEDFHGGGRYESWHYYNEEFGKKCLQI